MGFYNWNPLSRLTVLKHSSQAEKNPGASVFSCVQVTVFSIQLLIQEAQFRS